ncbi:MAG TPA: lipoyl(octanoyl) transferase LipB [Polyangiaceae bacterium]|nr:lipoyl(octanoyl) transferase LipB [Polyangiaceae bacterium]
MENSRHLHARWLGRQRYEPVLALQRQLFQERQAGRVEDTVLFVEHESVITMGRGTKPQHLLASRELLANLGVDLADIDRGGDVTLHAPGQLVCYPIVDLRPDRCDVRRYVNALSEAMRRTINDYQLDAGNIDGMVGLWVDTESKSTWPGQANAKSIAKIGAIGVRISRWVTMHGYALNLSTNLSQFQLIVPCGIAAHPVTSVEALTGEAIRVETAVPRAFTHLCAALEFNAGTFRDESDQRLE